MLVSQMLGFPERQGRQCPQLETKDMMHRSPGFTVVTPGPTSTTVPAPSCPSTAGSANAEPVPAMTWWSLAHIPAALVSTRTSPAFGGSCVNSRISRCRLPSYSTAAFTCNSLLLRSVVAEPTGDASHAHNYSLRPLEAVNETRQTATRQIFGPTGA